MKLLMRHLKALLAAEYAFLSIVGFGNIGFEWEDQSAVVAMIVAALIGYFWGLRARLSRVVFLGLIANALCYSSAHFYYTRFGFAPSWRVNGIFAMLFLAFGIPAIYVIGWPLAGCRVSWRFVQRFCWIADALILISQTIFYYRPERTWVRMESVLSPFYLLPLLLQGLLARREARSEKDTPRPRNIIAYSARRWRILRTRRGGALLANKLKAWAGAFTGAFIGYFIGGFLGGSGHFTYGNQSRSIQIQNWLDNNSCTILATILCALPGYWIARWFRLLTLCVIFLILMAVSGMGDILSIPGLYQYLKVLSQLLNDPDQLRMFIMNIAITSMNLFMDFAAVFALLAIIITRLKKHKFPLKLLRWSMSFIALGTVCLSFNMLNLMNFNRLISHMVILQAMPNILLAMGLWFTHEPDVRCVPASEIIISNGGNEYTS